MNKLPFTKTALSDIPPAERKHPDKPRYETYYDTKQTNLCLIVTDKGNKTFYMRRTVEGKPVRFKIGGFPDISVEQARKKTAEYIGRITMGEDVQKARKEKRNKLTLDDFFEKFLTRHAKVYKKTWKYDEEQYGRHISKPLGKKGLKEIQREDVEKVFFDLTENSGKATANHILTLISVIFNKAIEWGDFPMDRQIPTKYIKKHREKSRERVLETDEFPKFMKALEKEENQAFKDFVKMALLTGARKTNILSMQWKDIRWAEKEWRIPESKNGESYTVILLDEAMEILERRKEIDEVFVFPGTGKSGHFSDPKRPWQRLLKRAEIENLTMHDLRRTFATYQLRAGVEPLIISKTLGHKSLRVIQTYARANNELAREAMEKGTNLLMSHKK